MIKDVFVFALRDGIRLTFGALSSRVSTPVPPGKHIEAYEEYAKTVPPVGDIEGEREGESELQQMQELIATAISLVESGKAEAAKTEIEKLVAQTSCSRCSSQLVNIDWSNKNDTLAYLRTVYGLFPYYYTILEQESQLQKHTHPQFGSGTKGRSEAEGEGEEKKESEGKEGEEKAEEECRICDGIEALKICGDDGGCLKYLKSYKDAKKERNEKVYPRELIAKAKEYKGGKG